MNKKIILSSSIENRLITEVKRINDLMGTKLITEALISPKLTKFLSDIINASPDASKRAKWITDDVIKSATRLNNYLDNLPSNANISIPIILRDLKILSNSNVEIKNLVSDFFVGLEQYKPLFDEVNERLKLIPDLQKLRPAEVKQKLTDILTDIYTKGGTIPLDPQVADAINLIVTNKFVNTTLRGRYIDDIIIKNPNIFDALTSRGKTIVDNLNKNLETLATAKGQGGTLSLDEVSKLEQKIKNDFNLLYLWKRKFYDEYIKLLESYKTGATNVENAKLYDEIITDVKQHYGDWTVLEDISKKGSPMLDAIVKGAKSAVKIEESIIKGIWSGGVRLWNLARGLKNVETKVVDDTLKNVGPSFTRYAINYLIKGSPRGVPKKFTKGYENPYKEIIQNAGMWGANASYATEVLIRAYKLTIYLSIWNSLTKAIAAADSGVLSGFGEEGKQCMDKFSKMIADKNFSQSDIVTFLKSDKVFDELPCITQLNLTQEQLDDFVLAAIFRSFPFYEEGGWIAAPLGQFVREIVNRISNNPVTGIPIPAVNILGQLGKIFKVGWQDWFYGEMEQLRLPDLANPNDSVAGGTNSGTTNTTQQGPVRQNTTSTTSTPINTGRD
jgi:hypothetical protein